MTRIFFTGVSVAPNAAQDNRAELNRDQGPGFRLESARLAGTGVRLLAARFACYDCGHDANTRQRSERILVRGDPLTLGPFGRNPSLSVCRIGFPVESCDSTERWQVTPQQ